MNYSVVAQTSAPRLIACIRARVPAGKVSAVFGRYLDQIYAAGKSGSIDLDGQNIFVYRDSPVEGHLDVEFGVGTHRAFTDIGDITCTALPIGDVASTTHINDYARLGDAHQAVKDWCRANGRNREGTRWEIYGHVRPDEPMRIEVVHLLLSQAGR